MHLQDDLRERKSFNLLILSTVLTLTRLGNPCHSLCDKILTLLLLFITLHLLSFIIMMFVLLKMLWKLDSCSSQLFFDWKVKRFWIRLKKFESEWTKKWSISMIWIKIIILINKVSLFQANWITFQKAALNSFNC